MSASALLLAACAQVRVACSAAVLKSRSIATLQTVHCSQVCGLRGMSALLRPHVVQNPDYRDESYITFVWQCSYGDGTFEGISSVLVREWNPQSCQLLPQYFLSSTLQRAEVSAH
jgi:hypothetical protein